MFHAIVTLAILYLHPASAQENVVWRNALDLGVFGRAYEQLPRDFPSQRFPPMFSEILEPAVWDLSQTSTGMFLHFESNSPALYVRYNLTTNLIQMWHMASTGVSGMDLMTHSMDDPPEQPNFRWIATFNEQRAPPAVSEGLIIENTSLEPPPGQLRQYILYTPLRNGFTELFVGTPENYILQPSVWAPVQWKSRAPVVWYGTSIVHGASTTRPGLAFTSILSRNLTPRREVYNFGFAGNGRMDMSVAEAFAVIPEISVLIIDCVPNMSPQLIGERTVPFVRAFRASHPETAIIISEDTAHGAEWLLADIRNNRLAKRRNLFEAFNTLKSEGIQDLYYVEGEQLLLNPVTGLFDNPTIDGVHLTEEGFRRVGAFYADFINLINARQ